MKTLHFTIFLILLCLAMTRTINAQPTFGGSFTPTGNTSIIAGGIVLTADEGQAGFKCTLFSYVPTTNIRAYLH